MVDYCLPSLIAEGVICVGSWPAFCSPASLVANVSESFSSWACFLPVICILEFWCWENPRSQASKVAQGLGQCLLFWWCSTAGLPSWACSSFRAECVCMCVCAEGWGGTLQNGSPSPMALPWAASMRASLQQGLRAQGLLITPLVPQMHSCSAAYNIKRSSAGDSVLVISNNAYV